MSINQLSNKSVAELKSDLLKLREDQFKLRIKKSTGQLAQTHLLKDNKKSIARVKTILTQKAGI